MSFSIVTDSCANLPDELIEKYDISILPLYYIVEGKENLSYEKGKPTDLKPYYDMMRANMPLSTSSACKEICEDILISILDNGKDLLYIGLSSTLSITFDTVSKLLNELREKYPKQKIYHIDSLSASLGQGLLVLQAAKMRSDGCGIIKAYDWVQDNKRKVCHIIALDSATYPYRGGRLKKSQYIMANVLNIKPILAFDSAGDPIVTGKVFGRKNSLNRLVSKVAETINNPNEQTIYIGHGDCLVDAEYFLSALKQKVEFKDSIINIFDPIIGTHSGPGTIAVFYLAKSERI